jgi:OOP family OmpA-OmpF porin
MKKSIKLGVVASALMAVAGFAFAQTGAAYKPDPKRDLKIVDPRESPYVIDARGFVVRSGFGLCWRTAHWSVERAAAAKIENAPFPNWTAGCECDRDLMKAPACEPPPPPAAAPAAAPTPPPPPPPPPAPPAPTTEKVTFAADALFDFDKATLRPDGRAKLDDLVSKLAGVSLEVIIAVGYTDRIGSDAYNQRLSQRRAQAVKDYLVSKGIEPNRVYTEGKGEANPVKQCPDPSARGEVRNRQQLIACLQPNRRVEVEVVGTRPVRR